MMAVVGVALAFGGALVAALAALWAGLLALAEEAAVGEALHTLGDAPPATRGGRVPLHRALYVARLALLVLGAVAAGDAVNWWSRSWVEGLGRWAVAVGFLFIVGDALPRSLARVAPELAALALPLARRTLAPFGLLLWLLGWVDKGLHRLIATPRPLEPDLGVAQRDMLLGVFTLADTQVDEVMTPRLDMVAVDLAAATEDVVEAFGQSQHTRLPVYDGTPDNIVGTVFAKDLVPFAMGLGHGGGGVGGGEGGESEANDIEADGGAIGTRWQDLVRPANYVPETKTLDSQLRDFQRGPAHLAIVVDEFGGTSGLITLEDILEEIVGEIRDEHDVGEAPSIRQDGDRYWVDGRVTLDDLSAALGRAFDHPEVSTVGGLVYSVLGRVPRAGDAVTLDGYQVVVDRVDRRRVTRVLVQRQA
ncbi:MAG TPA: hemolysin family protein [Gemmatimonadales bacterium]|nr:hemolysin family protein [Gemmatimonadales bacterium]